MNRLPAEMIDLFKRWGRVEVHEVEQQTGESQPPSEGIMFSAGVVLTTPVVGSG